MQIQQLTLRGFDHELEKRIRDLAKRDHLSLNKAAIKLMRRGAGLETMEPTNKTIGIRLRKHTGHMSPEEANAIDMVVQEQRSMDVDLQS